MSFPYFYPRSPCGERLSADFVEIDDFKISIHALLAESDDHLQSHYNTPSNFYPRSPCGERRGFVCCAHAVTHISIHALLAESDEPLWAQYRRIINFYPRSPCGERLDDLTELRQITIISIHALLAESDKGVCLTVRTIDISIHALLAESDNKSRDSITIRPTFLSTLSLRRATAKVHKTVGHFCAYETNFMEIASSC